MGPGRSAQHLPGRRDGACPRDIPSPGKKQIINRQEVATKCRIERSTAYTESIHQVAGPVIAALGDKAQEAKLK